MSSRIIPPRKNAPFETTLFANARLAGGTIALDAERVEWLGDTLVKVEAPGLSQPLMLRTFEARDLALQLLNLSAHIDEEPREIRRRTDPGAPGYEELI